MNDSIETLWCKIGCNIQRASQGVALIHVQLPSCNFAKFQYSLDVMYA